LLEDQDETIVEILETENDADDSQQMSYDTEMLEIEEEEESYLDDSADPVIEEDENDRFEVLDLEELDIQDGINIGDVKNIAIISTSQENVDLDEVAQKMKAAHLAKEQLKKHKCPYCEKTFMFPSKGIKI
jgi:hypothetical protein